MDVAGRRAYALWLVPLQCGDGGVGALRGHHSHAKILHVAEVALGGGPCRLVIVIWCGLFSF